MSETVASGLKVALELPGPEHAQELVEGVLASTHLHHPWITGPASPEAYGSYLARVSSFDNHGFLARELSSGRLAGVVNVSNVILGVFRSGSLAYYGLEGSTGRGLMTEAVSLVVDQCFGPLGLHRVEANIQPANVRSRALVERLGFRYEGFSPAYLFIDGSWKDHDRFALLSEDPRPRTP